MVEQLLIKIEDLLIPHLFRDLVGKLSWLLKEMQERINKIVAKVLRFLDPRKSVVLYFTVFFLTIPIIVYAVVGQKMFEKGAAEGIGSSPPIQITSPEDGSYFTVDDTVDIKVSGVWSNGDVVSVSIKNNPQEGCEWVIDPQNPPDTTCRWHVTNEYLSPDPIEIRAVLERFSPPRIAYDTIHVYVISKGWEVIIVEPEDEAVVSGTIDIVWNVFGMNPFQTGLVNYTVTLEKVVTPEKEKKEKGVEIIIGTGDFNDVCWQTGSNPYDYQCRYENWDTTKHPNGEYMLVVNVYYRVCPICPQPPCFCGDKDEVDIIIKNMPANQKPICTSMEIQPTEVESGKPVTITATGSDPDGGNVTKGKVNFGDGQTSGDLNATGNSISTTHIYTVQQTTTFTVQAQFLDDEGVWGDWGCPTNVTVIGGSPNQCPYFISNPITTVKVDETYSYTINAVDPDGDQLIKGAAIKPRWLSFDSITGTLAGKPTSSDVGDHVVILYINDQHGCTISQSFVITVKSGEVEGGGAERHNPTVDITHPTQGDKLFCNHSLITWTASDQDGTVQKIKIEYSKDTNNWLLIVDNLQGSITSYEWDVCNIDPGNYYIKVTATDNDGLTGSDISDQFEVIKLGEISSSPKISDLRPPDGSTITELQPEISAKFTAQGSEIDVNSIKIKVDGEDVTPFAKRDKTGFTYKPISNLKKGEHNVSVEVSDEAKRTSRASWRFTISAKEERKAGTVNIFGKEVPIWLALSGLLCLVIGLVVLVIVAIVKLVRLGRETPGFPPTETDWSPPAQSGGPSIPSEQESTYGSTFGAPSGVGPTSPQQPMSAGSLGGPQSTPQNPPPTEQLVNEPYKPTVPI